MTEMKVINYRLKKTFVDRDEAKKEAREWQKKGFFTKIARTRFNWEVWVSEKQRWFYE